MTQTVTRPKDDLRILIDTSSWMHEHVESVIEHFFVPIVQESGRKLVVPVKVIEEINKHVTSKNPEVRRQAERAAAVVKRLRQRDVLDFFAGSEATFTDNVIQMVVVRFAEKYHFCLLTQDRALAADTLRMERRKSVRSKSVVAFRVGERGGLDVWELDARNETAVWRELERAPEGEAARQDQLGGKFRLCSGKAREPGEVRQIAQPVTTGAYVFNGAKKRFRLMSPIGADGEGVVYCH